MDNGKKAPQTSEQQMNTFRLRDKMCLLNAEFLKVCNGFYKEKGHYDFTATMQSYIEHAKQLKVMYKVDEEPVAPPVSSVKVKPVPAPEPVVKPAPPAKPSAVAPFQRKIAKATRRNGASATATESSPKVMNSTFLAVSSPVTQPPVPKFGDISVIAKDTPAPPATKSDDPAPAATPAGGVARKRAIRGGGPLGGGESVVFKSGDGAEVEKSSSAATTKIPEVTIKFPEPSKDFWTKKDDSTSAASNNGGSLFAFLGKDTDKSKEPAKFTGFSFGKKPANDDEKKKDDVAATSPSKPLIFGNSTSPATSLKPSAFSFGGVKNSEDSTAPKLSFGAKPSEDSAPKPLSFGSSLFGSSTGTTATAPGSSTGGLSFGSGGLFAGLAQKAMENKDKPAGSGGGDDDEGEYVPPKVETVENEEPDAVLSSKVSVFKFSGKEYTKLGVGMLHIKQTDGKFSVLIRAATTTGTVWLNSLCNAAMKATKVDEKGERVRLTCPTSMSEMTTMMIRFATADGAKKFTDKVGEVAK